MKPKQILFYLVVLIFLEACNLQEETNETFEMSVKCENIINSNEIAFNDIVEKYEMIKLETNKECLIGDIQKLFIHKNKLYILSGGNIFCFNMSGEFIFSISNSGRGPGEFIKLQDFSIDDELLYAYDNFGRKINIHNASDGSYISSVEALHSSHEMEIEGDYFHFNRLGLSNEFIEGNEMLISHQLNSPKDITINFPLVKLGKLENQLIKTNDNCIWIDPLFCNVYKIKGNTISNYLNLDFGKSNVTLKEINSTIYSSYKELGNAGKAYSLQEYYETSQLITAKLFVGNSIGYLIVDKENNSSVVFQGLFRTLELCQFFETVISSDSSNFYSLVSALVIQRQFEKMDENQLNKLDENMKNIFKSTEMSDNPVILVYKYKNSSESSIY